MSDENPKKMRLRVDWEGPPQTVDLLGGCSIAIDLDFDGPQPRHFDAEPATRSPMKVGQFVGRTSQGGSCNVDCIQLNPHCNGTHTESVGHIVNESVPVSKCLLDGLVSAVVITLKPTPGGQCRESYRPELSPDDLVLTAASIRTAWATSGAKGAEALIVRTIPNTNEKRTWNYGRETIPPFFSIEAIHAINELDVQHLLVDVPSIDRSNDNGLLTNHHLFWNVSERTHHLTDSVWTDKTITEMVFVPDSLADGRYLLNLQIAPFCSDAAPSRPILFPLRGPAE